MQLFNGSEFFAVERNVFEGDIRDGLCGAIHIRSDFARRIDADIAEGDAVNLAAAVAEGTADGSTGTETAPSADIAAILQQAAAELSLKVEADLSSGTKLKISATEETFNAVLAEILGSSTAEGAPATFTSRVLEVYLYIDKDGTFAQAAANIDIAGAIEIPASDTEEAQTIEFSAKGTASIKISADIPELPDDLNSYQEQA